MKKCQMLLSAARISQTIAFSIGYIAPQEYISLVHSQAAADGDTFCIGDVCELFNETSQRCSIRVEKICLDISEGD